MDSAFWLNHAARSCQACPEIAGGAHTGAHTEKRVPISKRARPVAARLAVARLPIERDGRGLAGGEATSLTPRFC
jgi:hypothetical protein